MVYWPDYDRAHQSVLKNQVKGKNKFMFLPSAEGRTPYLEPSYQLVTCHSKELLLGILRASMSMKITYFISENISHK